MVNSCFSRIFRKIPQKFDLSCLKITEKIFTTELVFVASLPYYFVDNVHSMVLGVVTCCMIKWLQCPSDMFAVSLWFCVHGSFRDGALEDFEARFLVPGDIVSMAVGDRVPADVRLLEVGSYGL